VRVTDLLRTIDLFAELTPDDLESLAHGMRDRYLQSGEILYRAGEPYPSAVIIVGGCIEQATSGVDGRPASTRQLGNGESFGETSLLSTAPQSATATAVGETRVLELHRDDFDAFVATRPQAMRAILAAISRRAVQANKRLLTDQAADSSVASSNHVYSVFSPRGGSGKTLLATRLAIRLAELMPHRVALLDLDLVFDDAGLQLEASPSAWLASLAEPDLLRLDAQSLTNLLSEHRSTLRVLIGATRPEEGERVTPTHVRAVLAALRRQFLVSVVDCGGTFSETTLSALEQSDRILMVCTPELVTLRDVRDCRRLFGQALNVNKNRVAYVMNHPVPSFGLSRSQFEDALEQRMLLELPHAGEAATKSGFSKAIDQLASEFRPVAATHDR
jgi:Flp pilus assembly CpaE family ATPase